MQDHDMDMFYVKLAVMMIVVGFLVWLVYHEFKLSKVARKQNDHQMRIIKMESYPNHEDRLKALEEEVSLLHRSIDALRTNSFTGETLRRVK